MNKAHILTFISVILSFTLSAQYSAKHDISPVDEDDFYKMVDHHYANNDGVKIHYATKGEGPLILFVHGFPDFWYTWRDQMKALSSDFKVAAMDLRGYNLSDSPDGAENYIYDKLVQDLIAVINDLGEESVHLVAHDWGAAISWQLAAYYPELVDRLVILSINHPKAGDKKVKVPIEERKPSYADYFVSDEFRDQLTENWFSGWVKDQGAKSLYKVAFRKSDKDAMINYYRANYPTLENLKNPDYLNRRKDMPKIKMPVCIIHGKKDPYALTKAHNNTWDHVDSELSIVVLPEAGHFIQQDENERVTQLISSFLSEK